MMKHQDSQAKNTERFVKQLKNNEYLLSVSEMKNILKNQSKEELIKNVDTADRVICKMCGTEYIRN